MNGTCLFRDAHPQREGDDDDSRYERKTSGVTERFSSCLALPWREILPSLPWRVIRENSLSFHLPRLSSVSLSSTAFLLDDDKIRDISCLTALIFFSWEHYSSTSDTQVYICSLDISETRHSLVVTKSAQHHPPSSSSSSSQLLFNNLSMWRIIIRLLS